MPIELCRHIMPIGERCNAPVIRRGGRFCYFHQKQKQLTARPPRPCSVTIPFQFPEDRASIQINLHLAQLAVLEGKLEPQQARVIIQSNRAAAINLKAGPLNTVDIRERVERVILTPEGEEIGPAREGILPDEELTHGPECPCAYCGETHRNEGTGELHHPDCDCGLCEEEPPATEPANNDAIPANENHDVALSSENKDVIKSNENQDVILSGGNNDVALSSGNNDVILSSEKKDVILSGVCRATANAVEEPALPPAQPQNHPSPHRSTPEGCHSERSEESALPLTQPQPSAEQKNQDAILSDKNNDVILSEATEGSAAEEPAVPPAQPQNHPSPQPSTPKGRHSEQREESALNSAQPTGQQKTPAKYSQQRINQEQSPESKTYDDFSSPSFTATQSESIISTKKAETTSIKIEPKIPTLQAVAERGWHGG